MRQNPVSHYGFINAKLRAKIGLMRERQIIDKLFKSESLVDAVAVLRDSPYHEVAQAYDQTGDLQQMELVLLGSEISMYHEVSKNLEGTSAQLVEHLLEKIEIDNLKNSLRLWYSSIIRQRPIRYRSEYLYKQQILHPVDWVALVNATSFESLCLSLKNTPYEVTVRSHGLQELEQEGLFVLENELDKLWYIRLMECVKALRKTDQDIASKVFLFEIDLKNILTLVRYGLYHQMESERIQTLLLNFGTVYQSKVTKAYLKQKVQERDPQRFFDTFLPNFQEIATIQGKSVHTEDLKVIQTLKIEGYLDVQRKAVYKKMLTADPFSIALPLAYFFLFTEETAMIKAILNGKYYGYDELYIRGILQ